MKNESPDSPNKIRPDLPNHFFWEYDLEKTDWQRDSVGIILRVIERGSKKHWEILVDFYGKERVLASLLGACDSFPEEIIAEVSDYFKIRPEDLRCSTPIPWRPKRWP